MKSFFTTTAAAMLLLLVAPAPAQPPAAASGSDARSLAAAETAFARESMEKGMRIAFLHALAPESIVFHPGPQNGREVWQATRESSGQLQWQPILAVVSASGDVGYTTGPWSFKNKPTDETPGAFGQFISIWRREGGEWKLRFDISSASSRPAGPPPRLQTIDLPRLTNASVGNDDLAAHDRRYAEEMRKRFAIDAADDVRVYRAGEFPAVGKHAAEALLARAAQPATFGAAKIEVSKAGDLGFLWGEYSAGASGGYYLRIWRRAGRGDWKLALDLLHPR